MRQPNPIVINEGPQVRQALRPLGLSVDMVAEIAKQAAAAKAEALEIDPSSAPGMMAYIKGVRAIRMALLPLEGWKISRAGNVEATVNHDRGVQIFFQNVDIACTDQQPQAISGKGAGSRKIIQDGRQGELFNNDESESEEDVGAVPTVWVICVSTSGGRLRAEVSCPEAFEGSQFEGFSKRIWIVDEDLGPTPGKIRSDDDGPVDHEVRIAKK